MQKRKKILGYSLIIVVTFLILSIKLYASEVDKVGQPIEPIEIGKEKVNEKEVIDYGMKLLDWESIEALQDELAQAMPQDIHFDMKQEMEKLLSGETSLTVSHILSYVLKALLNEGFVFLQFGARFILIVLLCNLLQTLSSSFKSKNTTKIAFFVCYMVILLSVVQSFRAMIDLAITLIDQTSRVMLVCTPILLAFMATSGFNVSAGAMAPVIISTLNLMTYFIKVIVLPCIISVIVLEVVSSMSEEFKVNKLIALFYKAIKWGLTSILGVSMSLLSLYRLTMPGVDMTLKRMTVKFSSLFIPVVGGAVGDTVNFITQCGSLIKNTFAGVVIMLMIILAAIPMIKILAYTWIYQIAGAVIEPIGDKKMATIATKLSKGCKCIMSSVGIIMLFCICALIICMTISSNGV